MNCQGKFGRTVFFFTLFKPNRYEFHIYRHTRPFAGDTLCLHGKLMNIGRKMVADGTVYSCEEVNIGKNEVSTHGTLR